MIQGINILRIFLAIGLFSIALASFLGLQHPNQIEGNAKLMIDETEELYEQGAS